MKILVLSPAYRDGGGTINVDKLLETLSQQQTHQIVFVSTLERSPPKSLVDVKFVSGRLSNFRISTVFFLLQLLRQERPDVVIANGRGGCVYGLFLSFFAKTIYCIPRGFQPALFSDRAYLAVYALLLSKKTKFIAVGSSEQKRLLSKVLGKLEVDLVRNPILGATQLPFDKNLKIYWVGRTTYEKRVADLQKFTELTKYDCIAYTPSPLQTSSSPSIQNIVGRSFIEHCSAAGVFLSFSEREGFPTAVAEAVLSGHVPVLSDIDAHREVVAKPLIFKTGDVHRCAQIVRRLMLLHRHGRLRGVVNKYLLVDRDAFHHRHFDKYWATCFESSLSQNEGRD